MTFILNLFFIAFANGNVLTWLKKQDMNHYCISLFDFREDNGFPIIDDTNTIPTIIFNNASASSLSFSTAQKICTSLSVIIPKSDKFLLDFLKQNRYVLKSELPYLILVNDKQILLESQVEPFVRATATKDFIHIFKRRTPMSSQPVTFAGSISKNVSYMVKKQFLL